MGRNKTRRNKTFGGKRSKKHIRKTHRHSTHKASHGADNWREGVMRVYKEMKAKNSSASFSDALKEASKRKKAGRL